jgi:hypothetical protein
VSERRIYEQLVQELRALQLESGTVFRIEQDPGGLIAGVLSNRRSSTTAPIVIEVERDDLVSLTIGEAAHLELYGKPADLKAEVIDWVRAVLRGSFTETILWRDDKVARSELRIVVAGSEQKVRYYSGITSLLPLGRLRKEARRYEAYS